MKKLLLPLSLGVLVAASANAQITLSQSSFASASMRGADTILTTASNPVYPALTADAGSNLDFTTTTSSNNRTYLYRVAGTGSNQWADSMVLNFSGFNYNAKLESTLSSSGYFMNGEHIDRVAYSLGALDFVPTDTLAINGQDISFSAPRTRIAFPATNQSTWSSTYKFDFGFTLTFTPLGLTNAAGVVRAYVSAKDTVIGYGKVRVQDKNGNGSAYMDVLQIDEYTTTVDSFFINGSLASPTLLGLFHLSQGQATRTKEQFYFRAGELTPLVDVTFDSSNTPTSAKTQSARVAETFIPETQLTRTINVYPNPVTNHTIMISGAPANYGKWSYEVENTIGQVVSKGALQLSGSQSGTAINLNSNIAPGTYFLHLYNDAAQQTVRTITVQ